MITGFFLGLMGSLHCAGMCGPLVLFTPVVGNSHSSIIASRLVYHSGRLTAYAVIGVLFGMIGESIALAGLQRWLSLIAGILMLAAICMTFFFKTQLTRAPIAIKSLFARFLHRRTFPAIFSLGATNGLLPCGLVYMAATASIATGGALNSIFYMLLFGLGTLPMLLAVSFGGSRLQFLKIPTLQKLAPLAIVAVAVLLIVRAQPGSLIREGGGKVACPGCAKK